VVFNIAGNKYRLVTSINYPYGIVFVKLLAPTSSTTPSMHKLSRDIMDIKPIRTDADYHAALREVESLMTAEFGTPEGDRLDVLATLVEAYEAKHFPMEVADPVEAIKFQMDQKGLTVKDLEPMIGRSNRVYEVLNRIRPLTLPMIWRLHKGLGIPAEALIQPPKRAGATA
jgi:HTH-type transcriptional regulator/antitoxin HigA